MINAVLSRLLAVAEDIESKLYYIKDGLKGIDREAEANPLLYPIDTFPNLSVRSHRILANENITTLGELVCRTEDDLLKMKNCGRHTLRDIKGALFERGLELGTPMRATAILFANGNVAFFDERANPDKAHNHGSFDEFTRCHPGARIVRLQY